MKFERSTFQRFLLIKFLFGKFKVTAVSDEFRNHNTNYKLI